MNSHVNIKISKDAFNLISELLKFHEEYDCVYLKPATSSCCKSAKVDLILDNVKDKEIVNNLDGLTIAYDKEFPTFFNEIVIAVSKSNLYIKAVESASSLLKLNSKCTSCNGCSNCKNRCNKKD